MVMIPWNQPTKPATPVANQLYVDDQKQVWQWDDTSKAWMRKPHMYLQEIEHMSLYTAGRSWFDFVRDVYPRHLFPQWPNLYTKTFCEFSFPITSTPSVYYSHPASVEEQDRLDSANLYRALTEHVIPCFFDRDAQGIPRRWIQTIRRAMVTLVPQYSTWRMVQEYTQKYYLAK